ncbi:MAG: GatB/YqeY domain-containing protein [Alphaproteobacteria bacterium]|nr:GatB/YqeY domain-containing protein [Alphaproteobacteria bacterium]
MRDRINAALKEAVKGRQGRRTATLRLVNAAIKDRDIDARGEGKEAVADQEIFQILQKMVKQRQESARIYGDAGRTDLETQELEEIEIIAEFLPQPLGEDDVAAAIDAAIAETGAEGLRDMGKVVGVLKSKFPGRIDFGKAAKVVKQRLDGS